MDDFEPRGFAVLENVISAEHCDSLEHLLEGIYTSAGTSKGGVRDLFRHCPELSTLVSWEAIQGLVAKRLGAKAFAVRAILFDKTSAANWNVPWHQDTMIAVKEKHNVVGYAAWSEKSGIPHVRPPCEVLEQMLTVRLHLDRCDSDNGPLRVIPGSHQGGILSPDAIERRRNETAERVCTVGCGGCVVISPLLLHASSKATQPKRRRVIHLEFASIELPEPLDWYERHSICR